jgi:hypothetical protein
MRVPIGVAMLCVVTACSHQALKVDCDRHLTAINPPMPVVKPATTSAESMTPIVPKPGVKPEVP